jgi:hypothetical protein
LYQEEKGDGKIAVKAILDGISDNGRSANALKTELFHHRELLKKGVTYIPKCFGDGYLDNNPIIKTEFVDYSI